MRKLQKLIEPIAPRSNKIKGTIVKTFRLEILPLQSVYHLRSGHVRAAIAVRAGQPHFESTPDQESGPHSRRNESRVPQSHLRMVHDVDGDAARFVGGMHLERESRPAAVFV